MAWYDGLSRLMDQGITPRGTQKMTILEPGGQPGYYQSDRLSRLSRAIDQFKVEQDLKTEARMKKMQDQMDMYRTLRTQGYDPSRAFASVQSGEITGEPTEKDAAQSAREKSALDIKESKSRIIKNTREAQAATFSKKQLEQRILKKIDDGEELTTGEQKIYDEVIRARKSDGGSDLSDVLKNSASAKGTETVDADTAAVKARAAGIKAAKDAGAATGKDVGAALASGPGSGMVAVVAPDGRKGKIPAAKVAAALKAGYKLVKKE